MGDWAAHSGRLLLSAATSALVTLTPHCCTAACLLGLGIACYTTVCPSKNKQCEEDGVPSDLLICEGPEGSGASSHPGQPPEVTQGRPLSHSTISYCTSVHHRAVPVVLVYLVPGAQHQPGAAWCTTSTYGIVDARLVACACILIACHAWACSGMQPRAVIAAVMS